LSHVIARSEAAKQSSFILWLHGLLRGACHRARIRATRWLAMTASKRATLPTVIVRESGRSSIPGTSVIEPMSRGVLDPACAGYDGCWWRRASGFCRHCEERLVRRSSTSEGGSDEAIQLSSFRDGPKDQTSDAQLRIGESRDSGLDASHRPGMTVHGLLRGACHRARVRATRWLAMTVSHNSLALENANDDTRRVFSSRIRVRVIGGSARWLQFSRSQSRQLTPIGVPSALSRSIPVA
jgi:hypothetical protein